MHRPDNQDQATSDATLLEHVRQWIAADPDPDTRRTLQRLVDSNDMFSLRSLWSTPLAFGTAGIRGPLGPGPSRMNRVTVGLTALGIAAFLKGHVGPDRVPRVVVGFDARTNSDVFACDVSELLAGAGLDVAIMRHSCPTPVLTFTVGERDADAGVMITASHNPAADNGMKVYLRVDGVAGQIIAPYDAAVLEQVPPTAALVDAPRSLPDRVLGNSTRGRYLARASSLIDEQTRQLRIVYTPLHGVGGTLMLAALSRCGFTDVHTVASQFFPDPDFPSVAYPNPEHPAALERAALLADEVDADVVLASDPDADRLAVMVRDLVSSEAGSVTQWRRLSGDEVGLLLADHLLETGRMPAGPLVTTVVSSTVLDTLAATRNRQVVRTLTGFKWISRVPGVAFGYEEALGYMLDPEAVPDKDGISAALVFAVMADQYKAAGTSVVDRLAALKARFGNWATAQADVPLGSPADGARLLDALVSDPPRLSDRAPVVVDHRSDGPLPRFDGVRLLVDGSWLLLRPSGTEPKAKIYAEVRSAPGAVSDDMSPQNRASELADFLRSWCTLVLERQER